MSILIVCPRYAPDAGGIETLLAHVLPALAARGLDFVVAAGTDRDDYPAFETIDGIPVHRIAFGGATLSANPHEILQASRRIREIEADHSVTVRHVQGFGDIGCWYAMRTHRRHPLPLAVSVHGTFEGLGALGPSARQLLVSADVVTAVSEPVRAAVRAEIPHVDGSVRLIPNGLPLDSQPPTPWPKDGPLLGVGRLLDQKGFDVAVAALRLLDETHPSLELVVAGGGPEADAIRVHAQRCGVSSRVRLLGPIPRDDVRLEMDHASIVLVPSRDTEGFSLVALEAAHAARPVIGTRVGGIVDTIEDGVTGLLVPPDDPSALAGAIAQLLDDPARTEVMGQAAHARAEERFPFELCVDGYHRVYEELQVTGLLSAASRA
jgi:glycogen(starch) synthase